MTPADKAVPKSWVQILDSETISRSISRLAYEIVEKDRNPAKLAIVGIRTAGEYLAKRIHAKIQEIENAQIAFGVIDITLYRDDLAMGSNHQPLLKGTDMNFPISGSRIVLVDDVLYTGRTVRAALDAIVDFGRPRCVELAALIDRGHRELPIRADYVGKNVPTKREEIIKVRLSEMGYDDGVYLVRDEGGKQ